MTLAVASEAEVRMELWRSFVSVLKSYAALAKAGEEAEATNLDDSPWSVSWSTLSTNGPRRFCLSLAYDAPKDKGIWWLHEWDEPVRMPGKIGLASLRRSFRCFSLHLDGTVSLDGSPLDMDHAAIQLMGWFSNAVKTGNIEVAA